jgi:hypothetical protein
MEAVSRAAYASVGRACGFAGLAIVCVMIGLSYDPLVAARTGAVLTFALTLVLGYRARSAVARPYRQTEAWLTLDAADRPPPGQAQQVLGRALAEAYSWFARQTALVTALLVLAAAGLAALDRAD